MATSPSRPGEPFDKGPPPPAPIIKLSDLDKSYVTPTKDLTSYLKLETDNPDKCNSRFPYPKDPFSKCFWPTPTEPTTTFDGTVTLVGEFVVANDDPDATDHEHDEVESRACVGSCFTGKFLSATFRTKRKPKALRKFSIEQNLWQCSSDDLNNDFLLETREIVEAIWKSLGLERNGGQATPEHHEGLVVFSGPTNVAKSSLGQAFALDAIRHALPQSENDPLPHLVTFEDPIEEWSIAVPSARQGKIMLTPETAHSYNFCITPRAKGTDVKSLRQALLDARRQTPTCFYIGEIRKQQDWKHAIEFAGTGHLVVTTTHAAGLSETIARILRAQKATTPVRRREVGGQLWTCVHLKATKVIEVTGNNNKPRKVVLPTVWARRGSALNALVGEGLSSIVPNNEFVLSRGQFFRQGILNALFQSQNTDPTKWKPGRPGFGVALNNAIDKAMLLDIQELCQQ